MPARHGNPPRRPARLALTIGAGLLACAVRAQPEAALQPVVVTASPSDTRSWTAPASIEVIDGEALRAGQLQVNLSEALARVPGLAIGNRQNHAQDLQLAIRGFGARATFGVRGVRLYVDGIPASAPDGQGQTAGFPLGAADRVEVIRGPYSALYGASAGGVVALYTADPRDVPTEWRAGLAAGADGLWRASTQGVGLWGETGYLLDVSGFGTQGVRAQSAARRDTAHLRLSRGDRDHRWVLVASHLDSQADDPLGLTRAQFDADPDQTVPVASTFDTRKTVRQTQLGLAGSHRLAPGHRVELMGYIGQREVRQFQAIAPAAQLAAGSAGGVIDLARRYHGLNARWRREQALADGRLTTVAGVSSDRQAEQRRGHENFIGDTLGVLGRLRRDETQRAATLDPYLQAEWDTPTWTLAAGVRRARVSLSAEDRYLAPGNGDDSGSVTHAGWLPVLGLRWRLDPAVQAFASLGRGLETPTLNEVAYAPAGGGFHASLRPARSESWEAGLRGRHGRAGWSATWFEARTRDEIAVLTNSGGRSTFQNVGRTLRRGLELAGEARWGPLHASTALTMLDAVFRDGFLTCAAAPCTTPTLPVAAGGAMPGIARRQASALLTWEATAASTFTLELQHRSALPVNDTGTDRAGGYTVAHLGWRMQRDVGTWRVRPFARIDNLTDRRHAGSVIVNEANGRFFETAPGRSFFVGVEIAARQP